MSFHSWFGRHVPDVDANHWDNGHFVSRCTVCGERMIRLPGLPWQVPERPSRPQR